jgi:hypothetical protein
MVSEKAMYWLAVGVMALGLNSSYQQGEFRWAHKLADHAVQAAEDAAQSGLTRLSMAEVMLGRNPVDVARLQGALAWIEARQTVRAAQTEELAQAQAQLEDLNGELQDLKSSAVEMKCQETERAQHVREQLSDVRVPHIHVKVPQIDVQVPEVVDGMLVMDGNQVDLRGLESLRSLESLNSLQGMQSMQSLAGLRSLRSLRSLSSMRNFQVMCPRGPMHVHVHTSHEDGGTI